MIVEATRAFAAEQLRPGAAEAEAADATSPDALKRAVNELGVTLVGVPEALGGMGNERSVTTGVLVAEALAHGDMGQAVAILAPAAVSNALVLWGDETQQATYLPPFVGDDVPAAALAVLEPAPLFDPFTLKTKATRSGGGFVLDGVEIARPPGRRRRSCSSWPRTWTAPRRCSSSSRARPVSRSRPNPRWACAPRRPGGWSWRR